MSTSESWIKPERLAANLRRVARELEGGSRGRIMRALEQSSVELAEATRRRLIEGRAPDGSSHCRRTGLTQWSTGGTRPGRDSGQLVRSITSGGVSKRGRSLVLAWGSPLPYLRWYEDGGTVLPRKARLLAVPLTRRAKRYSSPRQYPEELILIRSQNGRFWLIQKSADEREAWTFVYALIPKAVRPPRPVMPPSERDVDALNDRLLNALDREVSS